jgi:hypothetical protein
MKEKVKYQALNGSLNREARNLLTSHGIEPKSSGSLGSGFGFAWPMAQAIMVAG